MARLHEIMCDKENNMALLIECVEYLKRDVSERYFLISDLSYKLQQAEQ